MGEDKEQKKQFGTTAIDLSRVYDEVEQMKHPSTSEMYKGYTSSGQPLLQILKQNYKPPKPIMSPQEEKRARISAGISDGLGLLAEAFVLGQGGDVRNRQTPFAQTQLQAKLDKDRERIMREQALYDKIIADGALKDFELYMRNAGDEYTRKLAIAKGKADASAKWLIDQEEGKRKNALARKKFNHDLLMLQKKQDADADRDRKKHGYTMAQIRERNALRAANGGRSGSSGSAILRKRNGNYLVNVNSNKQDNLARTDAVGRYNRDIELSASEYQRAYANALHLYKKNPLFKHQFPYLRDTEDKEVEKDALGNSTQSSWDASTIDDFVQAYVQWAYDEMMQEKSAKGL